MSFILSGFDFEHIFEIILSLSSFFLYFKIVKMFSTAFAFLKLSVSLYLPSLYSSRFNFFSFVDSIAHHNSSNHNISFLLILIFSLSDFSVPAFFGVRTFILLVVRKIVAGIFFSFKILNAVE